MNRILLLLILFSGFSTVAQNRDVQRILNLPRTRIDKISPEENSNTVIISSEFSDGNLSSRVARLQGNVEKVYYIYTEYVQSSSFNQKELDRQRIERLATLYPEVLTNRFVSWEIITQTGCKSASEGTSYFHGFVVQFRENPSAESREDELKRLETFFQNPTAGFDSPNARSIEVQLEESTPVSSTLSDKPAAFPGGNFALYEYLRDNIQGGGKKALNQDDLWVKLKLDVDAQGKHEHFKLDGSYPDYIKDEINQLILGMPDWEPETKDGKAQSSTVNLDIRMSFSPIVRGMYYRDGQKPEFKQSEVEAIKNKADEPDNETLERVDRAENSAIYRGLNKVVPGEKVAVVMDVTSSMSDHIASMTWWVFNSPDSSNIVQYTFFNDGDNRPDNSKKVGKTGGVYHGTALRDFTAILMESMRNGNGGDLEENDYEALIAAQQENPAADAMVLIVDNYSDVRDLTLQSQITKKVHVLFSGKVNAIRECYLDLAKTTGGDVVVNGQRISLENVHSGSQITIAETTYLYDGKKFRIL